MFIDRRKNARFCIFCVICVGFLAYGRCDLGFNSTNGSQNFEDSTTTKNNESDDTGSHETIGAIVGLSVFLVVVLLAGGVCGGYCRYFRSKADATDPTVGSSVEYPTCTYLPAAQSGGARVFITELPPPYTEVAENRTAVYDQRQWGFADR